MQAWEQQIRQRQELEQTQLMARLASAEERASQLDHLRTSDTEEYAALKVCMSVRAYARVCAVFDTLFVSVSVLF